MMKFSLRAVLLMCLLSVNIIATAEIYRWTDEQGKMHFTDSPPTGKQVEEVEVKVKVNTYSAVEITPLIERLGRKNKVVMYTAAWCGICKKAKKYFHKNSIDYVAYDVEKSRTGKRDYKLLKARSVPIIIIGDKRMNGFNPAKFDKLYAQQMKKKTDVTKSEEGS